MTVHQMMHGANGRKHRTLTNAKAREHTEAQAAILNDRDLDVESRTRKLVAPRSAAKKLYEAAKAEARDLERAARAAYLSLDPRTRRLEATSRDLKAAADAANVCAGRSAADLLVFARDATKRQNEVFADALCQALSVLDQSDKSVVAARTLLDGWNAEARDRARNDWIVAHVEAERLAYDEAQALGTPIGPDLLNGIAMREVVLVVEDGNPDAMIVLRTQDVNAAYAMTGVSPAFANSAALPARPADVIADPLAVLTTANVEGAGVAA